MFPTLTRRFASAGAKLRNTTPTPTPPIPLSSSSSSSSSPPLSIKAYMPGGSRYKLKKVWPPDFSKLPAKEQFRFERRFKRRMRLASRRPRWDRFVKLMQLGTITSVLIYAVLFMEWDHEIQPFQDIRDKFWGAMSVFSSEPRYTQSKPDPPARVDPK